MAEESTIIAFIPKEETPGETRVSATPETIKALISHGLSVEVAAGAGEDSFISDEEYAKAGAHVVTGGTSSAADIVLCVQIPSPGHLQGLKENACIISFMDVPAQDTLQLFIDKKISFFSMNLIPRISRAQKMDALTSQASIAGYKAVLLAANELGKIFPLMMTAAGTLHPTKVVVLGAGVAGLQAIATAKRLGALVEASDVRPAVKEQVESLGAKFIEVPFDKDAEDKGGYAIGASPEFLKRQAHEVSKRISQADVVICTALVAGKKAPTLVTEEMVTSMRRGSVIVDMAAVQGGNCSLTIPGETVVKHGVKIIGVKNIPATVSYHASQMYAKNVLALVMSIIKHGKIDIDTADEVVAGSMVTHAGTITNAPIAKEFKANSGGAP